MIVEINGDIFAFQSEVNDIYSQFYGICSRQELLENYCRPFGHKDFIEKMASNPEPVLKWVEVKEKDFSYDSFEKIECNPADVVISGICKPVKEFIFGKVYILPWGKVALTYQVSGSYYIDQRIEFFDDIKSYNKAFILKGK